MGAMRARCLLVLTLAALASVARVSLLAQAGRGSLEGTWNFSTLTPLERPAEFAGRATVSDAEAGAWVTQSIERNDRDRRDGGAGVDVARAVNDYWFDRGENLALNRGRRMTSLIVDPPDGRLPPPTPPAPKRGAAPNPPKPPHPPPGPKNPAPPESGL